jgi:hypothetical protein
MDGMSWMVRKIYFRVLSDFNQRSMQKEHASTVGPKGNEPADRSRFLTLRRNFQIRIFLWLCCSSGWESIPQVLGVCGNMSFRDIGTRRRSQYKQVASKIRGRNEVNKKQLSQHQEAEVSSSKKLTLGEKQRQAQQARQAKSQVASESQKEKPAVEEVEVNPADRSKSSGSSSSSEFTKLCEEVKQFQKLVGGLERMINSEKNGMTPEDQWRTMTMLRSAEAADRDLGQRLLDPSQVTTDSVRRSAFAKLNRDYQRAHGTFQATTIKYQSKQRAEIALLTAKQHSVNGPVLEEDFYDRAMREREKDIFEVNKAMNKVNKIYKVCGTRCIVRGLCRRAF